jgi:hypothetical protein
LAEATGLEPAHAMSGDLANRCHTVRRRLQNCFSQEEVLEEGTGVEPASDKRAVVFGTTALPVRLPFQKGISDCELRISDLLLALGPLPFAVLAGTLGFEPRVSILETDGLPVSLHP